MNAQHTPGPWFVGAGTGYINQVAIDPAIGCAYGAGDEVMANARLIAAAPELLSVLRALLYRWDGADADDTPPLVVDARSLIAKATGSAA